MLTMYLTKSTHIFFIFMLSFFLLFGFWILFFVFSFIYILLAFFYRKLPNPKRDILIDGNDSSLFSPINGKVVGVTKNINHPFFGNNLTRIDMVLPLFKEIGISLPVTSEIIDKRDKHGTSSLRYKVKDFFNIENKYEDLSGVSLILQTMQKNKIGLYILKCKLGLYPEVFVMPGDRGFRHVNIGNMPFGGSVFVYLPEEYKVDLNLGQKLISGSTILARL